MAAEVCVDPCGFGTLFAKNLPHILEKIFFSLDYTSYNRCMLVSKIWNKLLTSEPYQKKGRSVFKDEILEHEDHLHLASIEGNKAKVERLLSHFLVDVNCESAPLRVAAHLGHKDVVQLLLDKGADPNKTNYDGWTPLHGAASRGHTNVVQLLLERGADPIKSDNYGHTPQYKAVVNGHKGVVQCLLDKGVDLRYYNFDGGPLYNGLQYKV